MFKFKEVKEKAKFLQLPRIIQERREKRWLRRSSAINSFDVESWPDGEQLRPVDPRERWRKMRTPDPWLGIMNAINSFQGQPSPSIGRRKPVPVDPREKWRQMAGKDIYDDTHLLERSTSRKFAHLRSEMSYYQEIAMRGGNTTPEWREKRKQDTRSRSFSIQDKLKKLFKKKSKQPADCTIPTINITEAFQDITEW